MKYFLATYKTCNGDHEYAEFGILTAPTGEKAEKQARKGRRFFTRAGWEEWCFLDYLQEIPKTDYAVLKKYFVAF